MKSTLSVDELESATSPAVVHERLQDAVGEAVIGQQRVVKRLTIALLAGGHVLLEGAPGIAKTTIIKRFAAGAGLSTGRIQLTSDILPADITGSHVYLENSGTFEMRRGPVFETAVIADEINRAPPKAQAALLEAMAEDHVTVDGETYELPSPFFLVATQNPLEMSGTYPLPESQLDRFLFRVDVRAPDNASGLSSILTTAENRLPTGHSDEDVAEQSEYAHLDSAPPARSAFDDDVPVSRAVDLSKRLVASVHVSQPVRGYLVTIGRALAEDERLAQGPSPRALISLQRAVKARAAVEKRAHALPEDVEALAADAFAHRLATTGAEFDGPSTRDIVDTTVEETVIPSPMNSASSTDPQGIDI